MTDWYKMNPVDWNDGTDDLTLEQEAAYLRLCHAIYITERPIRDNGFVVAGLLRCNDRKAKRLISELEAAGKITVENGLISNRRAAEEVSNRNRTRVERKSAGSRGGIESAKSRAKSLENNDTGQAIASTHVEPEEKRREESSVVAAPAYKYEQLSNAVLDAAGIGDFRAERAPGLLNLAPVLGLIDAGFVLDDEILPAIRFKAEAGFKFRSWSLLPQIVSEFADKRRGAAKTVRAAPAKPVNWDARVKAFYEDGTWAMGWGPRPGDPGCQAPAELLARTAA